MFFYLGSSAPEKLIAGAAFYTKREMGAIFTDKMACVLEA